MQYLNWIIGAEESFYKWGLMGQSFIKIIEDLFFTPYT